MLCSAAAWPALLALTVAGCASSGGLDAGASPTAGSPGGLVVITAGGTALADGADDVPPTLDLRISADGTVAARLDGATLALRRQGDALTASVAPLPLASAHRLDVDLAARDRRRISFHVVAPLRVQGALHYEAGAGTVLDLAFDLAPDHPAVEAAVSGGSRSWLDDRHLRVAWPVPPGGVLTLPAGIAADRGSHSTAALTLTLGPVGAGTLRRAVTPAPGPPPARPLVVAFSVATAASRASVAAHVAQISLLSPTGLSAAADGSLLGTPDPPAVGTALAQGVPVWPLLQNERFDTDAVGRLLHDDQASSRLIDALRARAASEGWAGVHLDFESVDPLNRDLFSGFVERLAAAMHQDGRRLAVAVVPHKPDHVTFYSAAYDLPVIARTADLVTLMAYEEHGPSGQPGAVAGLGWDEEVLAGSLADLGNPGHALLGLPFYARTWAESGAPADGYAGALATALGQPGAQVDYDFDADTAFVRPVVGGRPVTYFDDADSLARKLALVPPRGLAGIAVWRLGFEDPAFWALLPAVALRP